MAALQAASPTLQQALLLPPHDTLASPVQSLPVLQGRSQDLFLFVCFSPPQKAFPDCLSSHLLLFSQMPECIETVPHDSESPLVGRDLGSAHRVVVPSLKPKEPQESVNVLGSGGALVDILESLSEMIRIL